MGVEALTYKTYPLPAGGGATTFTVQKMVDLIRAGIKSPMVRQKAVAVLKATGVPSYNQRAEVNAIFQWVKRNFRFIKDPTLVELVHTPEKLLEIRSGDCDDFTVILSALLGAVGYETRVAIIGPAPGVWTHTFPEVWMGGKWQILDATAERSIVERARESGNYKTFALQGAPMLGQSPALSVQSAVVVNGMRLYRSVVQSTIDYLEGELSAGRIRPSELGRYLDVIPQDGSLTPLMKQAALKGVELVASYRFGLSPERLRQMARAAGPSDLGFLGGIFRGVKKAVGKVVGAAKGALGIPANVPVKVKVELPPPTEPPGAVSVAGAKIGLAFPSTGEALAAQAKSFFSSPMGLLAIAGLGLLVGPKLFGGRKRRR